MKIKKLFNIIKEFKDIDLWKTLTTNITVCGWSQGLMFPILIYKGTRLSGFKRNCIIFRVPLRQGILRIGKLLTQVSDKDTIISMGGGKLI